MQIASQVEVLLLLPPPLGKSKSRSEDVTSVDDEIELAEVPLLVVTTGLDPRLVDDRGVSGASEVLIVDSPTSEK
jgi:hypothetical protein